MAKKRKKNSKPAIQFLVGLITVSTLASFAYVLLTSNGVPKCANSLTCEESLNLQVDNNSEGVFMGQPVDVPPIDLAQSENQTPVLGEETPAGEKHIYVNLTTQTLTAYEGDILFMQTPISSGLWGKTPVGDFTIWIKLRSTKMSGGSGADYYYLPNVPYVMFFSNNKVPASAGFSLHGTYWHNNFGHPMSHGCVNMKTTDIAKLYQWATPVSNGTITRSTKNNPGTKITIFKES